ncbi:MAG: sugar ABC transporter ATP-binding protein [Planctomycetota bacterium]|nr:sugar ABC transporter ATP-binding protein [Planctomycetota bacterium]
MEPLLRVENLSKSFPGVQALAGVCLHGMPGEVLGVIGENGAGKSTLMKILAGVELPDCGTIQWRGAEVRFRKPSEAIEAGISLIHQELNLAENLSVAENLFLGREPTSWGIIQSRKMRQEADALLTRVGLEVPSSTLVGKLSIAQRQMVEIAKSLSTDAQLIIMDEPTSSLSGHESENLFRLIRQLKAQGVSIVYISHRLAEVADLADRVEVLRDGRNASTLQAGQIDHDRMVQAMVGRELDRYFPHVPKVPGEVRLELRQVRVLGHPEHPIDLEVRSGEIVGLSGLVGAGRTEVLEAIMGIRPVLGGSIRVDGKQLRPGRIRASIAEGLAMVPEDRRHAGLVTSMTVGENLTLAWLEKISSYGVISGRRDRRFGQEQVESLRIKTPSLQQMAALLSGGNQQKIVFGKWMMRSPKVLLLDEPTRGVDIGAKQEIYGLMERLAEQGAAILFVSSELEEILGMADRTVVMREGRIQGQLQRDQMSEQSIMRLAFGTGGVNPNGVEVAQWREPNTVKSGDP